MKTIYAGNLDVATNEDELRAAFAAYGQVDRVTMVRDRETGQPRGFAFVEMTNDGEAEKAIQAVNGTELRGRALNVSEARPKREHAAAGDRGGRGGDRGGRGGGRGGRGGGGGGRY